MGELYSKRRIALSLTSAALLVFGWFWVAANFTARNSAWWNSLWTMIAIFASGAATGLESRRGMPWLSKGALLWGLPLLNGLSMLVFLILAS